MNPDAAEIARALGGKKMAWYWRCRCPAHADKHPSLDIGDKNGKTVWKCRAGCLQDEVRQALVDKGLWSENGGKKTWLIKSAGGSVQATKTRVDPGKRIRWESGGVSTRDLLYLAEQTRNGYSSDKPIYVCEGEKDTDAAVRLGLQAVGTVGGANSCPTPETLSCLDGYPVILWPDYDEPGQKHMADISAKLYRAVQIVDTGVLWSGQAPAGQGAADLPDLPAGGLPVNDMPFQGRRIITVRASEVEQKDIDWFVEDYIPKGMLTILAGDPGTGKSFLSLDWCASASRAGQTSVYMAFEDSPEYTLAPRLQSLGADMEKVILVTGKQDGEHETAFDSDDLDLVDDCLTESGASVLIIDPIQAFTASGVDVWRDNQVRATLTPLSKLAEKHNCAVVIVMHLRKPPGGGRRTEVSIHDIRNSGDYVAAARSVIGVVYKSKDDYDGSRVVHHIKPTREKGPSFEFAIDTGGYHPLSVPRAGESGGGKVLNMPARPGQYAEETF